MNKVPEKIELLPCPLCCRDVFLHDFGGWEVVCGCGLMFAPNGDACESKEETAKIWNTRRSKVELI